MAPKAPLEQGNRRRQRPWLDADSFSVFSSFFSKMAGRHFLCEQP